MHDPQGQILDIVRKSLDPETVGIIEAAFHDAHRLTVIRDAFMEEKDALAVKMIRDLDPNGPQTRRLLPCSSGHIHPAQVAQIVTRPQVAAYRVTHLLVSPTCASSFDIVDIKVGNRSQFMQSGDIPADVFAVDAPVFDMPLDEHGGATLKIAKRAEACMPMIDLEQVETAMDLVITVVNVGTEPMRWRAAWLGTISARSF